MAVHFAKIKASVRAAALGCAFVVVGCAAAFAQNAPAPQQTPTTQAPAKVEGMVDPDKKVVQDRWGYSTGDSTAKTTKKGKPERSKPASDTQ